MRTPCSHLFLAFILKFLNFLQAFIGVVVIIYSAYMLNQWNHHQYPLPPPSQAGISLSADVISPLSFTSDAVSSRGEALRFNFRSLPAPWFEYVFMGVGILVCLITFIGHVGAEAISSCCLCFYAILTTIFILLEVGLVAFIALDHHWEKDIPVDPTGEFDSLHTFIEENVDVFKWIGICILIIQVVSVLLAIVLRSLISSQRVDADIEEDYGFNSSNRESLLSFRPSFCFN